MFKYELCETLKISSYRFDKEKDSFTVSGIQSVRAGGKTQQYAKFCRKEVYKKMLEEQLEIFKMDKKILKGN